jgi:hypothetical protein
MSDHDVPIDPEVVDALESLRRQAAARLTTTFCRTCDGPIALADEGWPIPRWQHLTAEPGPTHLPQPEVTR